MRNLFLRSCIFLFTLSVFLWTACSSYKEQTHKLTIAMPFGGRNYAELVGLSNYNTYPNLCYYDSLKNQYLYVYNNVPEGEVTCTFFSLFSEDYLHTLQLRRDTMIVFDDTLNKELKECHAKDIVDIAIEDSDTLFIGKSYFGCFSGGSEKIKIFKLNTNYQVEISNYERDIEKKVYSISVNTLNKALKAFLNATDKTAYLRPAMHEILTSNTRNPNTYVRKGDILYFLGYTVEGYNILKDIVLENAVKDTATRVIYEKKITKWDTLLKK